MAFGFKLKDAKNWLELKTLGEMKKNHGYKLPTGDTSLFVINETVIIQNKSCALVKCDSQSRQIINEAVKIRPVYLSSLDLFLLCKQCLELYLVRGRFVSFFSKHI